jgi:hypothetical protein
MPVPTVDGVLGGSLGRETWKEKCKRGDSAVLVVIGDF